MTAKGLETYFPDSKLKLAFSSLGIEACLLHSEQCNFKGFCFRHHRDRSLFFALR